MRAHVRACRNVPLFLALLAATSVGQTQTQKPGTYPTLPSETPAAFDPVRGTHKGHQCQEGVRT